MSDIEYTYGSKFICLRNGEQYTHLAQCPDGTEDSEEWNDNAEKIVDVLNSHASLVEENKRMREALAGLIEKYEEIVLDDDAGRSLKDIDLVRAKEALNA